MDIEAYETLGVWSIMRMVYNGGLEDGEGRKGGNNLLHYTYQALRASFITKAILYMPIFIIPEEIS